MVCCIVNAMLAWHRIIFFLHGNCHRTDSGHFSSLISSFIQQLYYDRLNFSLDYAFVGGSMNIEQRCRSVINFPVLAESKKKIAFVQASVPIRENPKQDQPQSTLRPCWTVNTVATNSAAAFKIHFICCNRTTMS